jgi:hypothetical protein
MSSILVEYENRLINKIRSAKSTEEVFSIIDLSYVQLMKMTTDNISMQTFVSDMQIALSEINPMFVADATEWSIIQEAKVRYYRISKASNRINKEGSKNF